MNPIRVWLTRVREECGSPQAMLMWASDVQHENTRLILIREAKNWCTELEARSVEMLNSVNAKKPA